MSALDAIFGFLQRIAKKGFQIMVAIKETGNSEFEVYKDGFSPRWIVIHHSFSADGTTRNWDSIRTYHTSYRYQGDIITKDQYEAHLAKGETAGLELPWHDIGYNLGVENVNGTLEVLPGRLIGSVGAHAIGFNNKSIGICLIGNYDMDPPSEDRIFTMVSLCRQLQIEFKIPRDQVIGHRETYVKRGVPVEKTCPGKLFDMDEFRKRLRD